jgi:hypothetical protein
MYSRGMRTTFTVFLQTLAKAHVALGCNEGRSEALRQGMAPPCPPPFSDDLNECLQVTGIKMRVSK